MKLKIRSLHMENFKGIKSLDVNFSENTKISGQNAAGKTTIFDAFTWLLFNKNSAGDEKFNVRPLNKEGTRIDNVEIKVVSIMDVDGKEVELSKVQKQNWVKKRGTNTVSLQGNPNSYEIDGYPKSEAEFKEYVSGIAQSEEMFKMLTNPQYFSSLKWKDQRNILMKLISDFSDVELAKTNAKYAPLLDELEKAPSTDDIRSKFSKALTEWKKKQTEIPVRIDEAEKSKIDVDVAEQELAKVDLVRRIAECGKKMENAGSTLGDLRSKEMQLQFDMSGIAQTMNRELSNRRSNIDADLCGCKNEMDHFKATISLKEKQIADNAKAIAEADAERKKLGEQYNAEKAKAFDETPYQFDESKWVFDDSTTVCSLCGQKLPDDKIEQIKADFEARKEKAKEDLFRKLADAKRNFVEQTNSNMENIKSKGFEQKRIIEDLTKKNAELQQSIESLEKQEQETLAQKEELSKQLSQLPEEADYSQNEEYVKLKAEHDEVLAKIEKLESEGADSVVDELKAEKSDLQARLDEANAIIAKASMNVEIDERIAELQEQQKEIGQKVADQEQMLYLLEEFIRFKLDKISDSINSHFKTVNFKLFEMQLNGGMKDCCECTVNGVPYSTLNSGHRIVAGLDIIRSLSELYGVSVPIFVDNCEAVSSGNLPDMESQMICLYVSEDKELVVSNE